MFNEKGFAIFSNEAFGDVRVVMQDGEPWFVAKDISDVLGYENPSEAVREHCDDVRLVSGGVLLGASDYKGLRDQGFSHNDIVRKHQVIPESDIYSLIFRSRLPEAKKFRKWVTSEVLPSIRKHGMYATDVLIEKMLNDPDYGVKVLQGFKERKEREKSASLSK